MRYRHPLDALLFSTTATRVLRALLRGGPQPLTGREVARRAGTPPHRTTEALESFRKEGVARMEVARRAYRWSVNEHHPLVGPARVLFAAEASAQQEQRDKIRRVLSSATGVRKAVIFGSAARGEEREGSDLDLLVVAANREALKKLEKKLWALRVELFDECGTRLSPLTYTSRVFERKRPLAVLQAAEREGEVLV